MLVVDDGALVEDADPSVLAANPESRYAQLLGAEQSLQTRMRRSPYRRVTLAEATLSDSEAAAS